MNTTENWEDLKYFVALAKEQKLLRAAKRLNSNHTTVYRRIVQFEKKFDIRLFERTPSGYYLTPAGEALYEKVNGLEDQMEDVFSSIQGLENKIKGNILITTTPTIAATFLPGILKKFKKKWPELTINLKSSNQFFNLTKREADIAIRPANDVPLHLIGRNLGKINFGLYGSKQFIRTYIHKRDNFDDFMNCSFITLDDSLEHLKSKKWLDRKLKEHNSIYQVDDLVIMTKMCASNLGLALIPHYMASEYKNLELLYTPNVFVGSDLWVLTQKNLSKVPRIKTCTDFLCEEISKTIQLD
jgi:DNA-binding transcriptional LysR family regulator